MCCGQLKWNSKVVKNISLFSFYKNYNAQERLFKNNNSFLFHVQFGNNYPEKRILNSTTHHEKNISVISNCFFFFWGNVNNKFYFIFLIPLGIDFSLHAITISSDKTLLSSPTCDRWRQGRDNMIIYKS